MTSVNCVQSPISSSRTSLSPSHRVNPNVPASCFSRFCINNGLVLSESSSVSISSISCNHHLTRQLSPKISLETNSHIFGPTPSGQQSNSRNSCPECPLNVSLLATVCEYKGDTNSALLSNCGEFTADEIFRSNAQENILESLQKQETYIANACPNDDDERTLKLAVELTMLNLENIQPSQNSVSSTVENKSHQEKHSQNNIHSSLNQTYSPVNNPYRMTTKVFLQTQSRTIPTTLNNKLSMNDVSNISKTNSLTDLTQTMVSSVISDERSKKSQNMTECVPVPSSEHVAEIVGRQGCKIKALRAKTNTYIKTPVRNEEPVFVVTGRKEDVSKAKLEILSAAEHFTVIRATRRINDNMGINSAVSGGKQQMLGIHKTHGPSCSQTPGQVTVQVRVPYRLVGLVVGTKGNTIKHIQHETQTYIVTPSRDKEPIFEVTGLADNVELARRHIEIHIATRLGSTKNNSAATSVSPTSPCTTIRQSVDMDSTESSLHSLNALNHMLNDDLHSEILSSIYKNGICSTLDCGHIRVNAINTDDKCNNINAMNGLFAEELECPSSYVLNNQLNNQLKCADFVNNLVDSTNSFCTEQRTQFT